MSGDLFWLSEAQFAKVAPFLPTDTRGVPRVDDRRVISGIIHVLKSGCRWIDAPSAYGPRKTLYNRFVRWADKGVWVGLFEALARSGGPTLQLMIDSSAVKAHRSAAGGKGGEKSGDRPFSRRPNHQNSCSDRRTLPSPRVPDHWRQRRRLHSRRGPCRTVARLRCRQWGQGL